MKILKTVMLVAALLLAPGYALSANLGYMRISLIEGDVQIKTPGSGDWGIASLNRPVGEGDQVWVPQGGRVELQLNSGTYIRLSEDSALQILSMDKDSSQFYLSQGYAYIYYDAPWGSVIQVDTPDASTRAFDKAIFRIDMSEQYTDVSVYKGSVETENRVGTTRINAGQMVSLGPNTNGELAPMGPSDDWETWNNTRNNRILARRGASSGYLPAELRVYSYDFDDSGRWVRVPDYGYVWTPTVVVGASWSPYRDGRWIWVGDDYVWVAFEPWGWAPYHYGRWSFAVNIGWFWVPPIAREVYWSPGYVGWVRTADYVAWVPLAPGEIYYGRGNYGRNSVNITTVNINQVNITQVYKNVNVNNGATIVDRNTFATASPRIVNVNQSVIQQKIFVRENISIGTPAIEPTRESHFSSARPVPAAKRPPPAVSNVQIPQLKQSRPFIREADKSVLNPGIKPKSLPVDAVTTPRTPGKGKPIMRQDTPAERVKPTAPDGGPDGRGENQQVQPAERVKPGGPVVSPTDRGERPQVKPEERGKPAMPEAGPTGRGGRQQDKPAEPGGPVVSPTDRGERPQVKPEERGKPVTPEAGPTGRGGRQQVQPAERVRPGGPVVSPTDRGERPQVKPEERGKPVMPEAGPTGRGEKQQVQPAEGVKPGGPVVSPTDRRERPQVKPEERGKPVIPEAGPTGRGEKQQVQPAERVRPGGPVVSPTDRRERPQVKPEERGKPVMPEAGPTDRGEKQQVQPAERVKPGGPVVSPTDRGERPQVKPEEKRKSVTPEAGPTGRDEKQRVKPDNKGKPGSPECGPGQKDEKNPDKCPQKDKKKGKEEPER